MSSNDINIRNLSKEKIESVFESLDLLLKRVFSLNKKYEVLFLLITRSLKLYI